jgi:hypothetical protein
MDEMYEQIMIKLEENFKHTFYNIPFFKEEFKFGDLMES